LSSIEPKTSARVGRGPSGDQPGEAEDQVDEQRRDHHRHEHQRDDPHGERPPEAPLAISERAIAIAA